MTSNDRENYFVLNCMISGVLIKIFNVDSLIFVAICSSNEVENPFHGHNFTDDSSFSASNFFKCYSLVLLIFQLSIVCFPFSISP